MRRSAASAMGWPTKQSPGCIPTHPIECAKLPCRTSLSDMARLWRRSLSLPAAPDLGA
jgi:hypothetical protein